MEGKWGQISQDLNIATQMIRIFDQDCNLHCYALNSKGFFFKVFKWIAQWFEMPKKLKIATMSADKTIPIAGHQPIPTEKQCMQDQFHDEHFWHISTCLSYKWNLRADYVRVLLFDYTYRNILETLCYILCIFSEIYTLKMYHEIRDQTINF